MVATVAPAAPHADQAVRPAVQVVLHVVPVAHAMTVVVLVAMTGVIASSPNQPSRRWW
jgi:sulfur relay (sulfurtransferase) DsrF/TusC family protein